jgi:hypothetical protein
MTTSKPAQDPPWRPTAAGAEREGRVSLFTWKDVRLLGAQPWQ